MIPNSLIAAASFPSTLLQSPSAWLGHLPFAGWIIRELEPKIVVELGTHYGHSYFSFCQSVAEAGIASKCYAVDTWLGDEHAGQYDDEIFAKVNAHHQERYAEFSRLLRMTFDDAATYFAAESIELLHIDGLHTYEAVRHDFETWLPKLAPGAVVMLHDTNVRERSFGVWKLWEELQTRYPNNLEFVHSHGLGVLQLNNAPDYKKLPWLEANLAEKEKLAHYFAALGSRQSERFELNQHAANLNHALAERDRQITNLNQTVAERDRQFTNLNKTMAERDGQIANLNQVMAEREGQISVLNQAVGEREGQIAAIYDSTSWRISSPVRFVALQIRRIRRVCALARPAFKLGGGVKNTVRRALKLFRHEGVAGMRRGFKFVATSGRIRIDATLRNEGLNPSPNRGYPNNALAIVSTRFAATTPLRTYHLLGMQSRRVNLVTDSIGRSSLFGGVGTAIILASLLAKELGAKLRIITRTEPASPENLYNIFSLYGLRLDCEIQFKSALFHDLNYEIDVTDSDIFITTSWWTTAATLSSVPHSSIIYLLQEDERMFYPFGDDRFRCDGILRNRDIRFVVNSTLLFEHFRQEGFDNIAARGISFEPAFPKAVFRSQSRLPTKKYNFFFYSRPNNQRNLFYLGLEVIERAILLQILDPECWDIYLIGKDIPDITFSGGCIPIRHEHLSWSEYAQLLGSIDLGLSLMYTPHPSYPPFDLAASGAVVVTNKFQNKRDLSEYSANIICAELNCDALVDALRKGVAQTMDSSLRSKNYRNNKFLVDWPQSFDHVINQLKGHLDCS